MVLGERLQLLVFSLLLGLVEAFSATRIIRSLLYSTSATDALSNVTYVARRGSAGMLYSSAPRHQSGPDGRIAIRIDLVANGGGVPPRTELEHSRPTGSCAASTAD